MSALITTSTLLALLHYTIASRCFSTQFLSEVFQYQPEDKLVGDWLSFPYDELLVNKTAIFNIGYKTNGSMHADVHIQPSTNIIRRRLDIIDKSQEVCSDIVRCRDPNILFMYCGTDLIVYKLEMFGLMYKKPYKVSLIGQICRVFLSNPGFEASIDFFCKRGHDVFLFSAQYEPSNHTMNIVNRGELTAYSKEGSDLYDQLSLQYYNETSTKSTILIGYKRPNTSKPIDYESSSFLYVYRFDPSDWSQNTRLSIMKLGSLYFSLSPPDPLDDTLKLIHLHVDRQVFVAYICNTHNRCHTCTCGIEVMVNKVACDRGRDQTTDGQLPVAFNASRSVVFDVHGIVTYATDAGVAKIYAIVDGVDLVRSNIIGVPRYMEWIDTGHRLPFRVSGVIRAFQVTAEIMVILGERVKEVNGVNKTFKVLITIKEGVLGVYDTSNLLKQHKIDCHISAIGSLTYNQYLGKTFFYQTCNSELHLMALARKKYIFKIGQTTNDFTDVEFTFECIDSDRKSIEVFKRNILVLRHPNIIQYASLPDIQRSIRTKHIQFPTYKSMVRGNGISFEMISPSERAIMYQYHSSIMQESILQVKFTTFTRLMELGDNYIAMFNDTYLQLVQCLEDNQKSRDPKSHKLTCRTSGSTNSMSDMFVLDMIKTTTDLIIALRHIDPVTNNCSLVVQVRGSGFMVIKLQKTYDIVPIGVVFQMNRAFILMHLVARRKDTNKTGLYYLQFKTADKSLTSQLLLNFEFSQDLTPRSISKAYRKRFLIHIVASHADMQGSNVISYFFDPENIAGSYTMHSFATNNEAFSVLCSSGDMVFMHNWSDNIFTAFQYSNHNNKHKMPLAEYGIVRVKHAVCEVQRRLALFLGEKQDGSTFLLAFRTEDVQTASRRLHSMIEVSRDATHILKVTSVKNDYMTPFLINKDREVVQTVKLYTYGPMLDISLKNSLTPRRTTLEYRVTMPSLSISQKTDDLIVNHTVELTSDMPEFSIQVLNNTMKTKIIDGITVDLEQNTKIRGSYFTAQVINDSAGFTIRDRLELTNAYQNVSFPKFGGSCAINGYLMAFYLDPFQISRIEFYDTNSGKLLHTIRYVHLIKYECLIRTTPRRSDRIYFIALTLDSKGFYTIHAYYSDGFPSHLPISPEAPYISYINLKLTCNSISDPVFVIGPSSTIIMSSQSLSSGYALNVRALRIDHSEILSSRIIEKKTLDMIEIADTVVAGGSLVLVMYRENRFSDLFILGFEVSSRIYENESLKIVLNTSMATYCQGGIVENSKMACRPGTTARNMLNLACYVMEENTFGYVRELEIDTTKIPYRIKTYKANMKIVSVPGLLPLEADIVGDFFIVRCEISLDEDIDKQNIVIYKLTTPTLDMYPYKIIGSRSLSPQLKRLGIDMKFNFSVIDYNYYQGHADTLASLHVNLRDSGILLFNITGLGVQITDTSVINENSEIYFDSLKSLDGKGSQTYIFGLHEMIDLNNTTIAYGLIRHDKELVLLILISTMAVCFIMLACLALFHSGRRQSRFELGELLLDESMHQSFMIDQLNNSSK